MNEDIISNIKLFGKWENNVEVKDSGLKKYICLKNILIPKSMGIHTKKRFHKSKMHIVERLALHMLVPGHIGRRHRLTSKHHAGMLDKSLQIIEHSLAKIEEKTKKNPIQVLVTALENGAIEEEVTSYQLGSITARDAVITSPQRRIDQAIKALAQGTYRGTFKKKATAVESLTKEIMSAYEKSPDSHIVKEKERIEREAMGAR